MVVAYLHKVLCSDSTFGIYFMQYLWHLKGITNGNIMGL